MIFVTGEPGIGKTALVEVFLKSLASSVQSLESKTHDGSLPDVQTLDPRRQTRDARLWIGHGQCIEHYGASEAYLPILAALGQLCREPSGQRLIELLTQHAPTWLVQMPTLLSVVELEALQRKTQGTIQERMLREFAEAVEALTREELLLLVLEDLHWSDVSTLDLLSFLARRRERARLLVIGTYRPVEVLAREHPLHAVKQELQLHGQCEELSLGLLTEAAVEEYLAVRSPRGARRAVPLQELARVIHHRTEGDPLFIVNMVDYLVAQRAIVQHDGQWIVRGGEEAIEVGMPQSLQQMIAKQIDWLSVDDRRLLEAASIAGIEFSVTAVAAALAADVEQIEEWCERLARRHLFLRPAGISEWPDGTLTTHYGFLHALYQNVLYERVTMTRRRRLHQRIGEGEEAGYRDQAREIAAELAVHFERSRDYKRAVKYFGQAAEKASGQSAHREAIGHLTRALELLKTLPDTPERIQQELSLHITLGPALLVTKGYAASETGKAYARARELCQRVGETRQLFPVLWGLWYFHSVRAEYQTARELGQQCLTLAQRVQDPVLLVEAHFALGLISLMLGEFTPAREHLEQEVAICDLQQHRPFALLYGQDPQVTSLSLAAWALWFLGYPDRALQRSEEALTLARELSHPYSLAYALISAAWLHQYRREEQRVQERVEAVIALCTEQGFPFWLPYGTILRGWVLAEQEQGEEGIALIQQGLAAVRATGTELGWSYNLALLAEAHGRVGQIEKGFSALAEALTVVDKTGERRYEAELYRLRGELTLAQSSVQRLGSSVKTGPGSGVQGLASEAEECFWKAIEIARRQQAKSLELRAVTSLARLWQQQGKKDEARQLLAEIYGWFTEGFDTADLQEAKMFLKELTEQN